MAKYSKEFIDIQGEKIEVRVYVEYRDSIRYSIGKKSVILRIPFFSRPELSKHLQKLQQWVTQKEMEKPGMLDHIRTRNYQDQDLLTVLGKEYKLNLVPDDRKNITAKIVDDDIRILYPVNANTKPKNEAIRKVIIKLLTAAYLPAIRRRVHHLNEKHFSERIERISLKYNTSNWGSCSSKRNINLSTRLLLTNMQVLDYVIVHELAHLKELNHSKKFWSIVKKAMPDYEKYEDWLKIHGPQCQF